jgi:hypothetical protein
MMSQHDEHQRREQELILLVRIIPLFYADLYKTLSSIVWSQPRKHLKEI